LALAYFDCIFVYYTGPIRERDEKVEWGDGVREHRGGGAVSPHLPILSAGRLDYRGHRLGKYMYMRFQEEILRSPI
jgi:hypothetical protein